MNERPAEWKKIESEIIADCRVFKVREDLCEHSIDKRKHNFFVIECPDWCNIIGLTESNEIVLIEQYRQGIEEIILELPGGMIDAGEEPLTAAKRELLEETGYSSDKFVYLGMSLPNPAIQNNWMYHYLALDCQLTAATKFDEHEELITKLVNFKEINELIKNGKILHSLVVAAFQYFALYQADK